MRFPYSDLRVGIASSSVIWPASSSDPIPNELEVKWAAAVERGPGSGRYCDVSGRERCRRNRTAIIRVNSTRIGDDCLMGTHQVGGNFSCCRMYLEQSALARNLLPVFRARLKLGLKMRNRKMWDQRCRITKDQIAVLENAGLKMQERKMRDWKTQDQNFGSRPSDHYFRSVCWFVCLSVCLFVCFCSFSQPSLIRFRSN